MILHKRVPLVVNNNLSLDRLLKLLHQKGFQGVPTLDEKSPYLPSPKWRQDQTGCHLAWFQVVSFEGRETNKLTRPENLRSPTLSECLHFFLTQTADALLREKDITAHNDYFRERGDGKTELRWMNQRSIFMTERNGKLRYVHGWYQTFDDDGDWVEVSGDVYSAAHEDYIEVPYSVPRGPRGYDGRSRYLLAER